MILKELFELLDTSPTPIKVVSSRTGKVLIHKYTPNTHSVFGTLAVRGIYPELYLTGITCKDMAGVRLVVWANEDEYKKLKQEDSEE